MGKVIRCADLGFDCSAIVRAPTEEDTLKAAAEHARRSHGISEITPEIAAKFKAAMNNDVPPAKPRGHPRSVK